MLLRVILLFLFLVLKKVFESAFWCLVHLGFFPFHFVRTLAWLGLIYCFLAFSSSNLRFVITSIRVFFSCSFR